jgi:hypothetical protein
MIAEAAGRLRENIKKVIVGKDDTIDLALIALLCGGHLLLEDVPGTGKTTLAKTVARSLGCSFQRIQFTPDLLPSDVTGIYFFDQKQQEFVFRPGPIFSQICWLMRSTGRRRARRRRYWKRCRKPRSRLTSPPMRCRALSGDGDAEPDRARRHVPATRGAARPFSHEDCHWLSGRRARRMIFSCALSGAIRWRRSGARRVA